MKHFNRINLVVVLLLAVSAGIPAAQAVTGLKLTFTGVEDLGPDFVYEGWIIVDGMPVSTGTFNVSPGGALHPAIFTVPDDQAAAATAFVLSIEPRYDHDPAPSDVKYLAGEFSGDMADLSLDHPAVLGTDFSMASGAYILETPSTAGTPGDYDQGIWFLDPAGSPDPSLDLPDLPAGWVYEGWIVTIDGPMSTGRFTMTDMADSDGGGPYAGPDGTPPFPGQDFIDPPLSLIGTTVVISVEPEPDNSADPFAIKPLLDSTVEDVGAGVLQNLAYFPENLPTGTAQFIDVVPLELDFVNLQDLGNDFVYEGWIVGHGPTSTGIFMVDETGVPSVDMVYVDKYVADNAAKFVLSIEPYPDPDPAPSNTKLLGGNFSGTAALLTIRDSAALGTDFFNATGGYILETPSTSGIADDWDQGIWFLDPGAGPGPSLYLPMLPEGWAYEGWVAGPDGPVTTGR
ncbi:MAG TPA: anti-sigma factor, partial [bacterium]|nr:anti-sigma factor [bacterium]